MKAIHCSLATPALNIACDTALLDWAESGEGEDFLRFWESPVPFVVVGNSRPVDGDVKILYCRAHGIPIIRRSTGGGTVVQGPGCLNYTLILRIGSRDELSSIGSTNSFVMGKMRTALAPWIDMDVEIAGHTDLAIGGMKISGNAQRRGKHFLLFHGTFLLDFDITLMHKVLKIPDKQPTYRKSRRHESFVRNLLLNSTVVRESICAEWNVGQMKECREHESGLPEWVMQRTEELASSRYTSDVWNFKK